MSHDQKVEFVANLMVMAMTTIALLFVGAPPWAAGGFGYVVFLILRQGDR